MLGSSESDEVSDWDMELVTDRVPVKLMEIVWSSVNVPSVTETVILGDMDSQVAVYS